MIRRVHPDAYHGRMPMTNFFEGWYFKLVTADASEAIALIPGVFWGKDASEHHSFLQLLDGSNVSYSYLSGPAPDFGFRGDPLQIQLGPFEFGFQALHLPDKAWPEQNTESPISGQISLDELVRWPDRWYSPGSMGPYNFLPRMQCHSQVCIVDAQLQGRLHLNGRTLDFDGGRGYVEKNWGRAFPYGWIWVQSSNFTDPTITVNCSIGHVPIGPGSFRGHLASVTWNGQFFPFTTMNRTRLQITPHGHDVELDFLGPEYRLQLRTESRKDRFILCRGPRDGNMVPMVWENLQGKVDLRLSHRQTKKTLAESTGLAAGIEYGGDQMKIIDQARS